MRLALKFGYDGRPFHGFARQPGQKTVEGDILWALSDIGILKKGQLPSDIRYGAASRTDAGVGAVGNVISFDTDFPRGALLRALNARLSDIWFHSQTAVRNDFVPRHARQRWYRYHIRGDDIGHRKDFYAALAIFRGSHDFSNFARARGENPVRKIDSIRNGRTASWQVIDIRAHSFLWNMVRRIVGGALAVSRGEITFATLKRALDHPEKTATLGIAPPDGLVLVDVAYDIPFSVDRKALELAASRIRKKIDEAGVTTTLGSYILKKLT